MTYMEYLGWDSTSSQITKHRNIFEHWKLNYSASSTVPHTVACYLAYSVVFYWKYIMAYSGILSGVMFGKYSGILSGVNSGILAGICSGALAVIHSGILLAKYLAFYLVRYFEILPNLLPFFLAYRTFSLARSLQLRSGRAHCDPELAVEVR